MNEVPKQLTEAVLKEQEQANQQAIKELNDYYKENQNGTRTKR